MKIFYHSVVAMVLLFTLLISCKKSEVYEDPYGGGQEPLAIKFLNRTPTPSRGTAGQAMTFYVKGLKNYSSSEIRFLANDLEATVREVTDSTITITLPANVSSGVASLRVAGQVFQGPNIFIEGKLYRDPAFKSGVGTNGFINDILAENNQYILAGTFTQYNLSLGVSGMTRINASGERIDGLTVGNALSGGLITSLLRLPNEDLMIGGFFSMFDSIGDMGGITRLTSSGSIRTRVVDLYVAPDISDPSYATDTVPQFAGVMGGLVNRLFYHNDQITVLGPELYYQYFYERSPKDNKLMDYASILPVSRLNLDGTIDSSFLFNKAQPKQKPAGFNGSVTDGWMQPDGKLIVIGGFTSFQGATANRILRLNPDGTIDPSFQAGKGANDRITGIKYNAATGKYLITGLFTSYDGVSINNIAMLNEDGSLYNGFQTSGVFGGGVPSFADQMSNGLIIVTGGFEKYNNISRKGLMVLNPDGSLAEGYNSTGALVGTARKMIETKSGIGGLPAVILVGQISTFEGERCGGILKLVFGN